MSRMTLPRIQVMRSMRKKSEPKRRRYCIFDILMKNIPLQSWLHPPGSSRIPLVNSDVQKIIDGLAKHNASSCTVCSRKRKSKGTKGGIQREPLYEVHVNDYTAPLYEEGESIRPSVPPKQAISTVLSQLKDEFHHLKLYFVPQV
jgi:hypothetical protein